MKTLKDAIELIMAEPPDPHYPAYYADLLREADVPDKDVGSCSETPNSSETIYRQEAIDAIELITWYHQNRNREMVKGANSQEDQAWYKAEDAYKVLNDLPSAESAWIPCSERFPEEGQRVLATHLGGLNPERQVIEHIYSDGKFLHGWEMDMDVDSPTFGQRYMGDVIAWMSLPEPYKAERRTDE